MPLSRLTTWPDKGDLTALDLNAEIDNIIDKFDGNIGGADMASPFTVPGPWDMDNNSILNASQIFGRRVVYPGTSIQSVIDELESSITAGEVYLAPGTHLSDASGIICPPGVSILGPGPESCVISSSIAGVVLTVGNGSSQTRQQRIRGFAIDGQSTNTHLIRIAVAGTNSRTNVRVDDMEIDGNGHASLLVGVDIPAAAYGVTISNSDLHDCNASAIKATAGARSLHVHHNRFDSNAISVECISTTHPIITENDFDSATTAHISLDRCLNPTTRGNTYDGTPTRHVWFVSNGTVDTDNNRGGTSKDNTYVGATPCHTIDGIRGHSWENNTMVGPTIVFASITGTQSLANSWLQNWPECRIWSGNPGGVFSYVVEVETEARPETAASGTGPGCRAIRMPRYGAGAGPTAPVTGTWTADAFGRMWIEDDGVGTTTLKYYESTGAVVSVALV